MSTTAPSGKKARQKPKIGKKCDTVNLAKHADEPKISQKKVKADKNIPIAPVGTAKDSISTPTIEAEEIISPQLSNGKKRKQEESSKTDTKKNAASQKRQKIKKANAIDEERVGDEATKKELTKEGMRKKAGGVSTQAGELVVKVVETGEVASKLKGKRKGGAEEKEKAAIFHNDPPKNLLKAGGKDKKLKSGRKLTSKSPEPSDEEEWGGVQNASLDDANVYLHGFSTDDDDSSDEDADMDDEPTGLDVAKLPTIAKDDATVQRKLEKARRQPTQDRGVLYLGRIPHGMYEDQLRSYFSQFGDVTRLRLSRNKKTGRSKAYAFIEFSSSSVAQIVADTMDNYLLAGHILRCKLIPKTEVHPELWVGANRKYRVVPQDRISRNIRNKPRTAEERSKAERRLIKRQKQKQRKLAEAGIEYEFGAIAYKQVKVASI